MVAHPVITQSNPTDGGVQMTIAVGTAAFPATLTGTGFTSTSVVQWTTNGGAPTSLQTTYISATQLVAQVPASLLTVAGLSGVTVRNADGSTSNAWPANVVARPVITQSNPTDGGVRMTIAAGAAAFPASLYGTGFATNSVVLWTTNGGATTSLQTTYVSATQITVQVPSLLLATAGTASFTVRNSDGSTSNAWPVSVVARPVITQTEPTDGGVQITISAGSDDP